MKRKVLFLMTSILLCLGTMQVYSQSRVSGVVTDAATGDPIIGASVLEDGTTNGTITDLNGQFEMSVADGAKVVISYVGYKSQVLTASAIMRVVMSEDSEILEEVVVTGYTTQRKADLTGAVAVLDMSKVSAESNPNMVGSLQGRLPGVQITTDAAPGSGGSSIRIRGMGTMNSCEPLYIIDGVPSQENLNSLNPSDLSLRRTPREKRSVSISGIPRLLIR